MVAWVVIFGFNPRQAAPGRHVTKIPSPQLLLFPTHTNRDARSSFRIPSCENCRVTSFDPSAFLLFATSFKPFLFIFLRTLLHATKTQLVCFHALPHSLPKTTRGGGTPCFPPLPIPLCPVRYQAALPPSQGLPRTPMTRFSYLGTGPWAAA